mmetsp:Transcript_15915/g.30807  ORF Transcript_15915/g.30807 Transcript_15915/m.30807 type:complete len:80 (+) Transcript_15915:3028-3267(+)
MLSTARLCYFFAAHDEANFETSSTALRGMTARPALAQYSLKDICQPRVAQPYAAVLACVRGHKVEFGARDPTQRFSLAR